MRNLLEVDGEAIDSNLAITEITLRAHFPNSFADSASFAVLTIRFVSCREEYFVLDVRVPVFFFVFSVFSEVSL